MCQFIEREYRCGHLRHIASSWCTTYATTHRRCPPEVTDFEYNPKLCGDCKAKNQPPVPWEYLIKRPNKRSAVAV